MTRCIPAEPAFTTASEREVWLALKRGLGDGDALFANLRFTDERGDSEADLVVAIPGAGIAVIEVKGGSVWRDGGSWRMHRHGVEVSVDPVEQARRTMYALRDYLYRDHRWHRRRVRMAPWSHCRTPRWTLSSRCRPARGPTCSTATTSPPTLPVPYGQSSPDSNGATRRPAPPTSTT